MSNKNIVNRRAKYDYSLEDEYQAGVVLSGPEVSSIRQNHVSLQGAFVTVKNDEVWINNLQIMPTKTNRQHFPESDQTRSRKLLLKQSQIEAIKKAKQSGRAVVPIKLISGRFIKIVISTGIGKKKVDKRQTIRARQDARDAASRIKHRR